MKKYKTIDELITLVTKYKTDGEIHIAGHNEDTLHNYYSTKDAILNDESIIYYLTKLKKLESNQSKFEIFESMKANNDLSNISVPRVVDPIDKIEELSNEMIEIKSKLYEYFRTDSELRGYSIFDMFSKHMRARKKSLLKTKKSCLDYFYRKSYEKA